MPSNRAVCCPSIGARRHAGARGKRRLDEVSAHAKVSTRLLMNLDLQNSPAEESQRIRNALAPGTVMPIHRHRSSSESCICIRGLFEEHLIRMATSPKP